MKRLTIRNAPIVIKQIQDEIRKNAGTRYDHRLHAILLVKQGISCAETARLLGDSERTVETWVAKYDRDGLAGLYEELAEEEIPLCGPSAEHITSKND